MSKRVLLSWLIFSTVFVISVYTFVVVRVNYGAVAAVLTSVSETKVVLDRVGFTEAEEGVSIDLYFGFRVPLALGVEVSFDAVSYSLSVSGVYLGRYSYWGGGVVLSDRPEKELFTSTAQMKSLYKERLLENLRAGRNEIIAEGQAEIRVVTRMGEQKVVLPVRWTFEI
jgi:hypothetical protein